MILVFIEGTKNTNTRFARLAVESNNLFRVFLAFDILFDLYIKDAVVFRNFGFFVHLYTLLAEKLVTVQAFRGRFAVFPVHELADVTEGEFGGSLSLNKLRKTRNKEVVRKLFDAT